MNTTTVSNTDILSNRIPEDVAAHQLLWVFEVETHRMIELEAYLRAEGDGFSASPYDYWLLAEKDVGCSVA